MHRLLRRQIERHLGAADALPEGMRPFLDAVSEAYGAADDDRAMVERTLELMSQELTVRNDDLRAQLAERQKSEAQLEALLSLLATILESTADGILAFHRDGTVARFNRQFIDMFAVPDDVIAFWRHASLMEAVLSRLVDPAAFAENVAYLCGHPEAEARDVFECLDGRVIERYSLSQPPGVEGVGRVISFRDITARVRAEEALRREQEEQRRLIRKLEEAHNQLLQSEKMASIGQLAAGVAHEINNPIGFVNSNLGTLAGYVDGLLRVIAAYEAAEGELAPARREALAALKRQADLDYLREDVRALLSESAEGLQRVRQIVQDLKDFSHVGSADWQWADLQKGLESTLNVVHNEIKYKADVVREYGPVPQVECLPSQLNQVFMNLLVNAAHAMGERRGTITVRTRQSGDRAVVEVADTGSGIAPENLTRIFDPFFTTKPVGQGTGLGLSLAYGIVEKHGGRIEVESEPGRGTAFRVILPLQRPADRAAA